MRAKNEGKKMEPSDLREMHLWNHPVGKRPLGGAAII